MVVVLTLVGYVGDTFYVNHTMQAANSITHVTTAAKTTWSNHVLEAEGTDLGCGVAYYSDN